MKPTCLVLGANGFVGSYIVDELAARNDCKVIAYDRFSRDPQFHNEGDIEIVKGDFFDDVALHEVVEKADYIIHTFSATTPFTSDSDPYSDISQNLVRNIQIFEMAVQADVKKIAYLSSGGAVYGDVPVGETMTESSVPYPVSPYGIAKLATEHYLSYFKRKYGLDHIIFRLTNPYGPRQRQKNSQGVIPVFVDRISNDMPITLMGDGTSSRDYIFMKDAAKMMVTAFFADSQYDLYNIGSGVQTELKHIVEEVENVLSKTAKIEYVEPPRTAIHNATISIDRYINEFGNPGLLTLEQGLKETYPR